jgi:acyl-CoA reductase-like NAD-dependent aldehyde dehydrogenase
MLTKWSGWLRAIAYDYPGETNRYRYFPRGISVVISPWNFPLAITTGMTVASLVTGNCTLLKPAENSSVIAAKIAEILYRSGHSPRGPPVLTRRSAQPWGLIWCSIPTCI